jgi:hypothetical protein
MRETRRDGRMLRATLRLVEPKLRGSRMDRPYGKVDGLAKPDGNFGSISVYGRIRSRTNYLGVKKSHDSTE